MSFSTPFFIRCRETGVGDYVTESLAETLGFPVPPHQILSEK